TARVVPIVWAIACSVREKTRPLWASLVVEWSLFTMIGSGVVRCVVSGLHSEEERAPLVRALARRVTRGRNAPRRRRLRFEIEANGRVFLPRRWTTMLMSNAATGMGLFG